MVTLLSTLRVVLPVNVVPSTLTTTMSLPLTPTDGGRTTSPTTLLLTAASPSPSPTPTTASLSLLSSPMSAPPVKPPTLSTFPSVPSTKLPLRRTVWSPSPGTSPTKRSTLMVSFILCRSFLVSLYYFGVSSIIHHLSRVHDNLLSFILRSAVFGLSSLSSFSIPVLGSVSLTPSELFSSIPIAVFLTGALSRTVES